VRKLIWQATILVLCSCAAFSWMIPAASAQDGALEVIEVDGECFISTSTSEIVITFTDILDEYEDRVIRTGTEEEVFSEELIPADCPDEVLGLAITGSNVNTPVAVGASMIGVGGLLAAAARKRRDETS
jgi:hypothetical protein